MRLKLSPRQAEVCALLAEGRTTRKVAEIMGISWGTVQQHIENAKKRNGGISRYTLMYQLGLLMGRNGVR